MPRRAAAARSTWFVPMQKQPMAVSFGAASSISAVSSVRDLIPRKWMSFRAALSASPESDFGSALMFS
jgi:hypothetical protein